jgi:hypothetical protein
VDSVVYWLELAVGDVWMVWYTGWNWLKVTCSILVGTDQTILTPKIFNHYPFLFYIYITYTTVTEIITILNYYVVTVTKITTFVHLYCCNNNITLKMAAIAAETCWGENCE